MKKISSVIFLSFVIIFLIVGCVKSPSVPVKDEPNVKPPMVEPPNARTRTSEPTIVKPPMVASRIPDSNVWEPFGKTKSGDNYYNKTAGANDCRTGCFVFQDPMKELFLFCGCFL